MRAGISSGSNVIAAAKGPGRDRICAPARDRRDAFDVNVINTRGNLIGGERARFGSRAPCPPRNNAGRSKAFERRKRKRYFLGEEKSRFRVGASAGCPRKKRRRNVDTCRSGQTGVEMMIVGEETRRGGAGARKSRKNSRRAGARAS